MKGRDTSKASAARFLASYEKRNRWNQPALVCPICRGLLQNIDGADQKTCGKPTCRAAYRRTIGW
jgi:hypothetical protein